MGSVQVVEKDSAFLPRYGEGFPALGGDAPDLAGTVEGRLLVFGAGAAAQEVDPFPVRTPEGVARAEAVAWRGPYQASRTIRQQINRQEVEYVDMHLSHVPQAVTFGFFGRINFAVLEATEITADGRVYLTTSIGASPTYLQHADQVFVEPLSQ